MTDKQNVSIVEKATTHIETATVIRDIDQAERWLKFRTDFIESMKVLKDGIEAIEKRNNIP